MLKLRCGFFSCCATPLCVYAMPMQRCRCVGVSTLLLGVPMVWPAGVLGDQHLHIPVLCLLPLSRGAQQYSLSQHWHPHEVCFSGCNLGAARALSSNHQHLVKLAANNSSHCRLWHWQCAWERHAMATHQHPVREAHTPTKGLKCTQIHAHKQRNTQQCVSVLWTPHT